MAEREKGIVEKSAYVARNAGIAIGVIAAQGLIQIKKNRIRTSYLILDSLMI